MTGASMAANAGAAADSPLLDIEALSVSIGATQIIKRLSLTVRAGEILGLVGASGSGKSMTALAIMGLLPAHARFTGAVRLRGKTLTAMDDAELRHIRGRDIGMVFQEPMTALNPLMTIGDQVAETVRLHRPVSHVEARLQARETLDQVGLSGVQGVLDRLPHELSGGQRQRVAIAIAVALTPPLLIADEPTTALDAGTQMQVLLLLRDLARTRNMGLILVTHDLAVVARLTDRVALMHDGGIVEQGETARLLRNFQHPYGRALLAAASLRPKHSAPPRSAPSQGVPPLGPPSRSALSPNMLPRELAAPQSSPAVLEVRGIVHEYPRRRRSIWHASAPFRAVDGVSLSLNAGQTVGLVGESGSGKSSLLRVILALEQQQSGEVRLLGDEFSAAKGAHLRRLRRSIQAVFQDPYGSFDPQWSVEKLISESFFLLDRPPGTAERRRRVDRVLEQVGLSPADATRYPHEFSGGQRQRIAIARALITEPAVIAFDEAVSALDVLVRAQILALLAELADRLQLSYLFVSHDLNVVRSIADRIYVMQRGQIVEEGPTEAVFAAPSHAYTRALIAATPQLGSLP